MILLVTTGQKIQFVPHCIIKLLWCESCWVFVKKKTILGPHHTSYAVTRCWLVFDDLFPGVEALIPISVTLPWMSCIECCVVYCDALRDGCTVFCVMFFLWIVSIRVVLSVALMVNCVSLCYFYPYFCHTTWAELCIVLCCNAFCDGCSVLSSVLCRVLSCDEWWLLCCFACCVLCHLFIVFCWVLL